MWCDTKKCGVDNSLHVAILWVIWLHRSHSFFNRVPWSGLQVLWRDAAYKLAQCGILFQGREKRGTDESGRSHGASTSGTSWPDPG